MTSRGTKLIQWAELLVAELGLWAELAELLVLLSDLLLLVQLPRSWRDDQLLLLTHNYKLLLLTELTGWLG